MASNKNTVRNRITMARQYKKYLTEFSNSYIALGRSKPWPTTDNVGNEIVPNASESRESIVDVYNNIISLKKITSADIMLATYTAVTNENWSSGTVYNEYTDKEDLFTTDFRNIGGGIVNVEAGTNDVFGTGTLFTSTVFVGDRIELTINDEFFGPITEVKTVINVASDTVLTVNSPWDNSYSNSEYIYIYSYPPYYYLGTNMFVSTGFGGATEVRVFKCLFNNNGAESTVQPEIDVGGSLPTNPYIETADGYKWKYLYSLSASEAEQFNDYFFTDQGTLLPVKVDPVVSGSAVDGRLDIIKIINGGSGYLSGGNSSSANIISVIGNGTGANVTANVLNGVIVGVNVNDGGSGYTNASISVSGGGSNANLVAVIGPKGGHGFDPVEELGAAALFFSIEIPENDINFPAYAVERRWRQVSIITDPLDSDGNYADNLTYNATYVVKTSTPSGGGIFYVSDAVYQGNSYVDSTFTGDIVYWDVDNNEIWLNNVTGTFTAPSELRSNSIVGNPVVSVTAFQMKEPQIKLNSGDVLYVRNDGPDGGWFGEYIRIAASF